MNDVVPDVVGVIEAWRSWRFYGNTGLVSVFQETRWPAQREMEAQCHMMPQFRILFPTLSRMNPKDVPANLRTVYEQRNASPPHNGCSCGIYATQRNNYLHIPSADVYGKVALWGKVIKGTLAVRAQYAYPIELYTRDDLVNHPKLQAYGVPVYPMSRLPWKQKVIFGMPMQRSKALRIALILLLPVMAGLNLGIGLMTLMRGDWAGWFNIAIATALSGVMIRRILT